MRHKRGTVRLRVGKNIQRFRLLREFSQERLAELAGNSAKHMGQIERGEVNVGIDVLARIARALSVEIEDLFVRFSRSNRRRQPEYFFITQPEMDHLVQIVRRNDVVRVGRSRPRRSR